MSRLQLITLGCLLTLVVTAAASAEASAHRYVAGPCRMGSDPSTRKWSNSVKCFDQTPLGGEPLGTWEHDAIGVAKVEGTSGVSKLEAAVLKVNITIECKKDTFAGTVETSGGSKGEIELTECSVPSAGKCKVKEPIASNLSGTLIGEKEDEDEFKPASGETFAEITLTGSECAFKGTYKITGTQTCKLPKGEELVVEHEIECTPAGSKLKLGGEPAKFTSTEHVKLVSSEEWGVE